VMGCCEHGNEPSGSVNKENILMRCVIISFSERTQLLGTSSVAVLTPVT